MKILYITTSYEQCNSSAAIRNNGLIKGFIELGHEVDVLTVAWPTILKSRFLMSSNKANVIRTPLAELDVVTYTQKVSRSYGWMTKLRHFIRDLIYFPDICSRWPNYVKDFDASEYSVVISSSDSKSSHYTALKIKQKYPNKPWIQIWGDPWASDVNLGKIQRGRARHAEYMLLKKADKVIYVSDPTKNTISNTYPEIKDKLYYVPRSYYTEIPSNASLKNKQVYRILYPGVLSIGRNIENLLKAINHYNIQHEGRIELHLYGRYPVEKIQLLRKYEFVSLHDSVDFGRVIELLGEYEIALLISNGLNSTQIPGKLFDYMGSQLPVLCLVPSYNIPVIATLKMFSRCFIAKDSEEEILKKIEEIIAEYKQYDYEYEFSPKNIAKKIVDIIAS